MKSASAALASPGSKTLLMVTSSSCHLACVRTFAASPAPSTAFASLAGWKAAVVPIHVEGIWLDVPVFSSMLLSSVALLVQVCLSFYEPRRRQASGWWSGRAEERLYWERWVMDLGLAPTGRWRDDGQGGVGLRAAHSSKYCMVQQLGYAPLCHPHGVHHVLITRYVFGVYA